MKARVVLIGPFGVGKSSLAKTLVRDDSRPVRYELEQLATTRARRPGEDDLEYEFMAPETFEAQRPSFLLVQPNRGVSWSYALRQDHPLADKTVRLYVVLPEVAEFLRRTYPDEILICGILPPSEEVARQRLIERDTTIPTEELALRLQRMDDETKLTRSIADLIFYNEDNLVTSAATLGELIETWLADKEK